MQRLRSMRSLQKFASVHASVCKHFTQERALYSRDNFKLNRAAALAEWRALGAAQGAASLSLQRRVRIRLTPPFRLKTQVRYHQFPTTTIALLAINSCILGPALLRSN